MEEKREGKRSTAAVVDWLPAPWLKISAVFLWSTNADCRKCGPTRLKAGFDVLAVSFLFPSLWAINCDMFPYLWVIDCDTFYVKMVQKCSAYGCLNKARKESGITFHKFPSIKREAGRKKWIFAMKRKYLNFSHAMILGYVLTISGQTTFSQALKFKFWNLPSLSSL